MQVELVIGSKESKCRIEWWKVRPAGDKERVGDRMKHRRDKQQRRELASEASTWSWTRTRIQECTSVCTYLLVLQCEKGFFKNCLGRSPDPSGPCCSGLNLVLQCSTSDDIHHSCSGNPGREVTPGHACIHKLQYYRNPADNSTMPGN
jgi:hypothetical protein